MDPITRTILIGTFCIGMLAFICWVVDRENTKIKNEKGLVPPNCFSIDDIYILFVNDKRNYTDRVTRRSLKSLCKQFEMHADLRNRHYVLKNVSFTYKISVYRGLPLTKIDITDTIHELRIPFDKAVVQARQNMDYFMYADEGDIILSQSINYADYRGSYYICYKV